MAEGVLAEIVRRKHGDVQARLAGATLDPPPTPRSLRSAIARPGARFIMEAKKRSPSGHRSDFDVARAVEAYAPVADAISVLTDTPYFGGSLHDLEVARSRFDGPILAKDFVIDGRQVTEARLHGADAVLAILSVLDDSAAALIMAEARRLSMDVIVEVHDEQELGRALALGAAIIGINNRDLRTLRTDLSVTERLAGMVPDDVALVSESGIGSRRGVERLSHRVDAFLVGSSLMASPDIAQSARALAFGQVKICGLTEQSDVAATAAAGATHAGFVFAEGSPRKVGSDAGDLAAEARQSGLKAVGVFAGQAQSDIIRLSSELELDAVQLHDQHDLQAMRTALPSHCEIWSVAGVEAAIEPAAQGADRTLFDTKSRGRTGGTGTSFDWRLVANHPELPHAFLAGGIGPANARAAQQVGAFGIDLCSSVEATPGRKDHRQVRALFDALRLPSRGDLSC